MKHLIASAAFLLCCVTAFAQSVGINTGNTAAHPSAMLDVRSSSKGFLIPRVDSAARVAIIAPATGLMLIDTNYNVLYCYDGAAWRYTTFLQAQTLGITSGTATWDCAKGLDAAIILTANTSLSLTHVLPGMKGLLKIQQDGTGNRQLLLPAGSRVSRGSSGQPAISTAPSTTDILIFYYDGQSWYWNVLNNFN